MQRMLLDFDPSARGAALRLLLLPYEDLTIIRARRKYMPILRVRPRNLPHRAGVSAITEGVRIAAATELQHENNAPFERVPRVGACLALDDVEHLHGAV